MKFQEALDFIMKNKEWLNFSKIERSIGCPTATLYKAIKGRQSFPEKYQKPLIKLVTAILDPYHILPNNIFPPHIVAEKSQKRIDNDKKNPDPDPSPEPEDDQLPLVSESVPIVGNATSSFRQKLRSSKTGIQQLLSDGRL